MTQYLIEEALALRLELAEEAEKATAETSAGEVAAIGKSLDRRAQMLQVAGQMG